MNRFALKGIIIKTAIAFIIPIILCLVFLVTNYGGIGPFVLAYSIVSFIWFMGAYKGSFKLKRSELFSVFLCFAFNLLMSVIMLNYFMFITSLLGVMNYQSM